MQRTSTIRSTRSVTPAGWRACPRAAGFTLTEILIVIGLIVLIIALAVPAFNAMTGGRSVDAASNTLSAMLGRARMEAIGLQEPRGLLFYRDPATTRVAARLVRASGAGPSGSGVVGFELVEDRDAMLLPVGVGLQMVDDAAMSGTGAAQQAKDDRYIGFNKRVGPNDTRVAVGGIILFDQGGRLANMRYGFRVGQPKPGATSGPFDITETGRFLLVKTGAPSLQVIGNYTNLNALRTQFGFVLYDDEPFKNQGFTDEDPQVMTGAGVGPTSPEGKEEAWLDSNALPVLINRYNGTLIRGE